MAEAAAQWQLRLLGEASLVERGSLRAIVLRPKDAALLALVALTGSVQPEHVAGLLWPAATARQADTSLRQRLFRLRRETGATLVVTSAQLSLATDLSTDLAPVLDLLREDEQAGRSELLGDLQFDKLPELAAWVGAERQRWRGQRRPVGRRRGRARCARRLH